MGNLKSRIIKGLMANGYVVFSIALIQIISVPVFIKFWGVGLYSDWIILSTIPTYLSISDKGLTNVAANLMAIDIAKKSYSNALQAFQSSWVLISCISLLFLAMTCIIFVIDISSILNLSNLNTREVNQLILYLVLNLITAQQLALVYSVYRSDGNYALGTMITANIRILAFVLIIVGVFLDFKPVDVAKIQFIVTLIGLIYARAVLKKKSPWAIYGIKNIKIKNIISIIRPSFAFMAFPAGHALKHQAMVIIIGIYLGATFVVLFSTVKTLLNFISQIIGMINSAITPEVSKAYGSNNIGLLKTMHRKFTKLSFWTSISFAFFLFMIGEQIINVWTLNEVKIDRIFFNIMLLGTIFYSLWFTSASIPMSINKHESIAFVLILSNLIAVLIAIYFIQLYGLVGVSLIIVLSDFFMIIYVTNISIRITKDSNLSFFKNFFK